MKKIMGVLWAIVALQAQAQTNLANLSPTLKLPKDSGDMVLLRSSLYQLLSEVRSGNFQDSKYIYPEQKVETQLLLQAIQGSEKNEKKNIAYTPYIAGIRAYDGHKYILNLSFLGIYQSAPACNAAFTIAAYKSGSRFVFASPLKQIAADWKTFKSGEFTFYYKFKLNESKVKEYIKFANMLDKKMQSAGKITEVYMCDDYADAQRNIGVDFKDAYQGIRYGLFQTIFLNKIIVVNGGKEPYFDDFNAHDVWNERLNLVQPLDKVNKAVSEGCAYLYGGRWGFNWTDIVRIFKEKVASDKSTDWKRVKEKPLNFWTSDEKPFFADYVVNGLLAQKIEKEKGFASVLEWMSNTSANGYYQSLEKLTGISAVNYNEKISELISQTK